MQSQDLSIITTYILTPIIIFLFVLIYSLIKKHNTIKNNFVKQTSKKYKQLLTLNNLYKNKFIYSIKNTYTHYDAFNTKRQYDRVNGRLPEHFLNYVGSNIESFEFLIKSLKNNIKMLKEYLNSISSIKGIDHEIDFGDFKITQANFIKRENKILQQNILPAPVTNTRYILRISYTSPKGRNHYSNRIVADFNDLHYYYYKAKEQIEERSTRKYIIKRERDMMTSSLRYDILQRDNFACVVCGTTATDGVKLEVDHIIPIARGGKTKKSNLQTLCFYCNRGKSAKI